KSGKLTVRKRARVTNNPPPTINVQRSFQLILDKIITTAVINKKTSEIPKSGSCIINDTGIHTANINFVTSQKSVFIMLIAYFSLCITISLAMKSIKQNLAIQYD